MVRRKKVYLPVIGVYYPLIPLTVYPVKVTERIASAISGLGDKTDEFIISFCPDEYLREASTDDLAAIPACAVCVGSRERFGDGTSAVIVNVKRRVVITGVTRVTDLSGGPDFELRATCEEKILEPYDNPEADREVMRRHLYYAFKDYTVSHNSSLSKDLVDIILNADSMTVVCDAIAAGILRKEPDCREYLDLKSENELANYLLAIMSLDSQQQRLMEKIRNNAKESIELNQKIYFLNEHMKSVQQEMKNLKNAKRSLDGGKDSAEAADPDGEADTDEVAKLSARIKASGMPEDVAAKCNAELKKIAMQPGYSQDTAVVRNYIETILSLPWNTFSPLKKDLREARAVLDDAHYGLEKVKERILEYLAVQNRADRLHAPIICLVGPPGVGKTSLGMSIAKATGRKYVRMALGGMRDEAEIRGHRRTYVGALPGRIIQKISKCGVKNPLFLLDEIDKVATDSFRGDPSSALLEVLDPEQNRAFTDNYLEVDFDLSHVMFMATANTYDIPPALRDRMEIIDLSSYSEEEKMHIAREHLIPKQMGENHVTADEIAFTDDAVLTLIRSYTREAGVRSLEREIGRLCRKTVKNIMLSEEGEKTGRLTVDGDAVRRMLGPWLYDEDDVNHEDRVGIVNGLAYTSVGGEILTIEATCMPGYGRQVFTGKLGDVMKESISAAFTVVRAFVSGKGYTARYFRQNDFHIHCPEGAIPKDGPSAGIAMCTAIISAITGTPVRGDVAMTGEITLRGDVLPIGGVKEKLLGAVRGGVKRVLIPKGNVKDLEDVPESARKALEIIPVRHIDEVFREALAGRVKKYAPKKDEPADEEAEEAAADAAEKKPRARRAAKPGARKKPAADGGAPVPLINPGGAPEPVPSGDISPAGPG